MCPVLKIFLFQGCQEITEEAYINSHFMTHCYLNILNVAGNGVALPQRCLNELLKYNNRRVLLDIRGHHRESTREHPDALERVFEEVDDLNYVHNCYQFKVIVPQHL